ncbi:MAG: riboflavin synthase [Solirubrobacteraceae bacterium]
MFTGLVGDLGVVTAFAGGRLRVATKLAAELREGDSIAVRGVCLTALAPSAESFEADVIDETLSRTSLGTLASGARVNLELPLRAGDRLGGHIVQGHVDGLATVVSLDAHGMLRVDVEPALLRYVVEKGSIALDGVSLTVAAVDERGLAVALIPETLRSTTLGDAEPGDKLNVEVDIMAKHLEKLVAA